MNISTLRNDTPLGPWTYSEWRPQPFSHLAGLVEVVWYFKGPTSSVRKRILPNGMVEMLVNFGEPYRTITGAGPELLKTAWLGGLQSGPMVSAQPPRQDVMGVRLCPAGAYTLLDGPMREISELVVDLEDLVGRAAGELAERCYDAASVEERLRRAADWAAARSPSPSCDNRLDCRKPDWPRRSANRLDLRRSFIPASFAFAARRRCCRKAQNR